MVFVDYYSAADTNYVYDCLDNWVESDDGGTPIIYLHNELNQYVQVGPSGGQITYTYDGNGNLTFDGTYHYRYDCENRLIDVNDQSNNRVASYSYDFSGRRISKTVGSTTTTYVYDGAQIIAEYENGTLARKFIYGPGIDEPICMITCSGGETKYFYHFDGLGSVVALTNSSGTVIEQYSYDVFGTPTIRNTQDAILTTSAFGNSRMFTGREYDSETGNYYYRARYYKPSIGRFLSADPIGYADSMNLYQYCHNNPVMFVDPWGLLSWGGFLKGTANVIGNIENSVGGKLLSAYSEGVGEGAAAWADGAIPGANPFKKYYDSSQGVYKFSRAMGHISRDALITAISSPAKLAQYLKNPKLYEAGSVALRNAIYEKYGLEGLTALEKGRILLSGRSFWEVAKMSNYAKGFILLFKGGLTPGGGIMTILGCEAADYMTNKKSE